MTAKLPFRTLKELKNIKGKRVLLRLDLNEPVKGGRVENDFRLRRSIPTIDFLKKLGAKIIIVSHVDPPTPSLKPIVRYFGRFTKVGFVPDVLGPLAKKAVANLADGSAIVLENVRNIRGEEKNSDGTARAFSSFADIFVNDAFSVSHRTHASIVGVPKLLPSYAGLLFTEEYKHLSRALKPKKPLLLILGGAKPETKLPLIKRYLPLAKNIFVGGALANALFREKGYEIGKSVVGGKVPGLNPLISNKKIILPEDTLLLSGKICGTDEISSKDKMVDAGPATLKALKVQIGGARSIIFNGPVGIYDEGFASGTENILSMMSRSRAETIVGGGDTLALVTKLKLEKSFSFVSTGGGAMLEFLAKGTLPGIEALKTSK